MFRTCFMIVFEFVYTLWHIFALKETRLKHEINLKIIGLKTKFMYLKGWETKLI